MTIERILKKRQVLPLQGATTQMLITPRVVLTISYNRGRPQHSQCECVQCVHVCVCLCMLSCWCICASCCPPTWELWLQRSRRCGSHRRSGRWRRTRPGRTRRSGTSTGLLDAEECWIVGISNTLPAREKQQSGVLSDTCWSRVFSFWLKNAQSFIIYSPPVPRPPGCCRA